MNTKDIGERTEAIILSELMKRGESVLLPFGDNKRYDLVLERDGKFLRIQCKTGRLKNGAVGFQTCSTYGHRGRGRRDYQGEIDYFAVYCPELDKV